MENVKKIFEDNADIFYKIYDSVRDDDVKLLDTILIKYPEFIGVPVYGNVDKNESLLHFAASRGKKNTCLYLIKKGICVNVVDCWYCTSLEYVAGQGDIELVKELISIGAWVNGDSRGIITPLISAVIEGHIEIVKYLLDCGADINRLHRRFNQTALDFASLYNNQNIIELLKSRGGLSAQEQIDLKNERGDGILEHVDHKVGSILSTVITKDTIDLRTALIKNDKKFKLIFTIGVFESLPRTELMMSVPYDWPINLQIIGEKCVDSFPIQLMFSLGQYSLDGNALREGIVIEKIDTKWNQLEWPENIDAFILTDYQINPSLEQVDEVDEEVSLLLLVPIKYPKTGCPKRKKLEDWLKKHQSAKWGKVSLKV